MFSQIVSLLVDVRLECYDFSVAMIVDCLTFNLWNRFKLYKSFLAIDPYTPHLLIMNTCFLMLLRECPLDLKEAISSVCFAAPRCADLPELLQVHMLFASKYGKEFVSAATGLMPDCGVNRQVEWIIILVDLIVRLLHIFIFLAIFHSMLICILPLIYSCS